MSRTTAADVVIVDYGMGNLFSVQRACHAAGIASATITDDARRIGRAQGLLLPGVGAFGDAMRVLGERNLVDPIREFARSGRPVMGICLGMQLMLSESTEFGRHAGLDLVPGTVVRLSEAHTADRALKVPQVGWNQIHGPARFLSTFEHGPAAVVGTPLESLADGAYMYFVHSYCVCPQEAEVVLSTTEYGGVRFCSSLLRGNLFATQFHPERSGKEGIRVYRGFLRMIQAADKEQRHAA
jgi:glutamine amidotransferase